MSEISNERLTDDRLASNMRKTLVSLCDVVGGWQEKCAVLESTIATLKADAERDKARIRELVQWIQEVRTCEDDCVLCAPHSNLIHEIFLKGGIERLTRK